MVKKHIIAFGLALFLLLAIGSCTQKTTEITNITSSDWIKVEGGTFNNGTSDVTISTFYLFKYEVTQAEYQALAGDNPSGFPDVEKGPVERVSWLKSIGFCNLKSINDGLTPCYTYSSYGTNPADWPAGWSTGIDNHNNVTCNWTAKGYRLPTEMEWQFAAMGGNMTHDFTYSGSDYVTAVAWYSGNSDASVHAIGTKSSNELGLYDMSGNVWEWCWDIWNSEYLTGPQTNPHGPTSGFTRVTRGGAYNTANASCQVEHRSSTSPAGSVFGMGIRLCRSSL